MLDRTEVELKIEGRPVAYAEAISRMEERVAAIRKGAASEMVWLLEHPPLYTAGTSADPEELLDPERFPVFRAGRGGRFTYHGPGQRVAYVMLDLKRRGADLHAYVRNLEQWLIDTLAAFDVRGERRKGRVGIWVAVEGPGGAPGGEAKIAAIGVRLRKGVTYHGASINLNPDLEHYAGIVPCGVSEHGVTSLHDLGVCISMADLDAVLSKSFGKVFGT